MFTRVLILLIKKGFLYQMQINFLFSSLGIMHVFGITEVGFDLGSHGYN